jgi:hypothetical protein
MLTVYSIPGRVNGGDGAVPKECQLKLSYQFCMKVHRMGNLKPSLSKDLFYAASQKNGIKMLLISVVKFPDLNDFLRKQEVFGLELIDFHTF